jgi:hypothetical protein
MMLAAAVFAACSVALLAFSQEKAGAFFPGQKRYRTYLDTPTSPHGLWPGRPRLLPRTRRSPGRAVGLNPDAFDGPRPRAYR